MAQDSVGRRRTRRRFGRIRKLPSGRWQAGYTGPDGTVHGADQTFSTKAAAERWLSLAEADIVRGEWSAPERRAETVGEWADRWLAQGQWKPGTNRQYRQVVSTHVLPRWESVSVGAVAREDVRAWAAELTGGGSSAATVRHAVGTLARILGLAVEAGALTANPATQLRLASPRPRRGLEVLTPEQVEALATEIAQPEIRVGGNGSLGAGRTFRPDLALWVRIGAYCGLRAGEIGALRRSRINLDDGMLTISESLADVSGRLQFGSPKSGHTRTVPIPQSLVPDLAEHLARSVGDGGDALLMANERGEPLRHAYLYRRHFRPAVARAGLPSDLRFHDLRHTYAALLIAQGAHPRSIMERMGHSSITVTLGTYGHLFPSLEAELTTRLDRRISGARTAPLLHGDCTPRNADDSREPKNGL